MTHHRVAGVPVKEVCKGSFCPDALSAAIDHPGLLASTMRSDSSTEASQTGSTSLAGGMQQQHVECAAMLLEAKAGLTTHQCVILSTAAKMLQHSDHNASNKVSSS